MAKKITIREIKKDVKVKELPLSTLEKELSPKESILTNEDVSPMSTQKIKTQQSRAQRDELNLESPQQFNPNDEGKENAPLSYNPRRNSADFTYLPRNTPITSPEVVRRLQESSRVVNLNPRNNLSDRFASANIPLQSSPDDMFKQNNNLSLTPDNFQDYSLDNPNDIKPIKRRTELL